MYLLDGWLLGGYAARSPLVRAFDHLPTPPRLRIACLVLVLHHFSTLTFLPLCSFTIHCLLSLCTPASRYVFSFLFASSLSSVSMSFLILFTSALRVSLASPASWADLRGTANLCFVDGGIVEPSSLSGRVVYRDPFTSEAAAYATKLSAQISQAGSFCRVSCLVPA